MTQIEIFKSESRYRHAGALAFILGCDASYGCHYGMQGLNRAFAKSEFAAGYIQAMRDYEAARNYFWN